MGDDEMKKDNTKKKNKNRWQYIVSLLIGGVFGGLIGYYGTFYPDLIGGDITDIGYILLSMGIAIYVQLILHEAGHLLFGVLTGYRFVSFRVGSFTWYKKQGKMHLGKYSIAGTAGQCLMAPPDMQDGKMPYRLYNLGGALMNLLVSLAAFLIYLISSQRSLLFYFCFMLVFVGVLFASTNGIPMRLAGVDNDGYNALSLGKTPEALRGFWLQLKINEMLTEGMRLKEMPEVWFEKPLEVGMENSMIAAIEAMRCNRLLDTMEFETVNQEIEEVVTGENGMVGVQKMLLQIDQIFCEIFTDRREKILSQMKDKQLVQFMKSMKKFPSVLRTQYAYALLIENDRKKAEKLRTQFEKIMKSHPYEGEVKSEWELIRLCEQNLMS